MQLQTARTLAIPSQSAKGRIGSASLISVPVVVGLDGGTKFGGMTIPDAKRLKQLEEENARLKKFWRKRCWTMRC
jgi:hypothetical protein